MLTPFITSEAIHARIEELSKLIAHDHGSAVNFITVLEGARPFSLTLSEALRKRSCEVNVCTIKLSSYKGETSSNSLALEKDINEDLSGKDVVIVEDIVDTGLTMKFLLKHLALKGVRHIKIASLLNKPSRRKYPVRIDYLGFTIDDLFVVGFGLDFHGKYRNLPSLAIYKPTK